MKKISGPKFSGLTGLLLGLIICVYCSASTECLHRAGDLNDDCLIDMTDLLIMIDQWLEAECTWPNCADIDDVLGVDLPDYAIMAENWLQAGSPVVINEFMARNDTTLTDEDGEYSDWIELHNLSSTPVDLTGWSLTNDSDGSNTWQLPSVTIQPEQFLVIFASGENRTGANLHTDFELEGQGEYLALLWPNGSVGYQFSPEYPLQAEDVSYGLVYNSTLDAYVEAFFMTPTPGAANGVSEVNLGPVITEAVHLPHEPYSFQHVTVSAQIDTKVSAINNVTLFYRVMYGPEESVPMTDDGLNNDLVAGDGIYTAVIPAETATPGQMLRYYIQAADDLGFESRLPLGIDQSGEDQSPLYLGLVISDPQVSSKIPILHWFTENESASETYSGTRASLYFNQKFYDNVFVRTRGSASASWPKHKFKFDFYGDVFQYSEDFPAVEEFNLQSYYREVLNSANTSYMRENMAYEFLGDADVPACNTIHLHVRRNAGYYGLFSFIEQVDETFLRRHGFDPEGALYKSINCCSGTLKPLSMGSYPSYYRKITDKENPYDDLYELTHSINVSNPDRFNYVFDYVDLPQVINYMTAQCVMTNHDRLTKNYHVYREPDTLLWHWIPWDLDQSYTVGNYLTHENWKHPFYGNPSHTQELSGGAPNPNWQNHIYTVIFENSLTQQMFLRRLRSLMDKYLVNNSAYFAQMAQAYYTKIFEEAELDNAKWGAGRIINGYNEIIADNLPTRRSQLQTEYSSAGLNLIPDSQASLTVNFGDIEVNPASGNQDEEYIELINPNPIAADISGCKIAGAVDFTFQPGTVIPAQTSLYIVPSVSAFRERTESPTGGQGLFVQGNYSGHLSSWGETLYLMDTTGGIIDQTSYAPNPSDQQRYLRVTELMYHPPSPPTPGIYTDEDYEFIELMNIGTETLDLSGVKSTEGIAFDFSGSGQTQEHVTLIDIEDTWKYEQSDTDLPAEWITSGYDDSSWQQGGSLLYYENSALPAPKNTQLDIGALTCYFRKQFYLNADPAADTITLTANTVIDDGAIFYLNGVEVLRIGMPTGTIEHSRLADRIVDNAVFEGPFTIDASHLNAGANTLAVEVHQSRTTSSDIVMGMTLEADIFQDTGPVQTLLEPDALMLLVKNIEAFSQRYPAAVDKIAGQYSGSLSNGGERIKLEDSTNSTVLDFSYRDGWYSITDGGGFSLEIQNPQETDLSKWDSLTGWRPGVTYNGTPGQYQPQNIPVAGSVVINELLAHSDLYPNDWVELHNTTAQPIDISGWFLSDSDSDVSSLKKYEIPTPTVIDPHSYVVFTQDQHFGNPSAAGCHSPFALSENGEKVFLSSGSGGQLTGYAEQQDFDASQVGVSMGIHQTSTGKTVFVAMQSPTPGSANSHPAVGPLVISEVMYHPTDGGAYDNDEYEYIELINISGQAVPLWQYDAQAGESVSWKFTDGIDFTFPQGASIPAGGKALVVNNISAFNQRYGMIWGVQVFGSYANDTKLSNSGEKIELSMPGDIDQFGQRKYIQIDTVKYSDGTEPGDLWPNTPDGHGDTLTRVNLTTYGNDVSNWTSAAPSPGS